MFIEEAFERLLLDYDRVFSAMGIPACLWRRTGEIYKGNKEFADLVGVDVSRLKDVSGFCSSRCGTYLMGWDIRAGFAYMNVGRNCLAISSNEADGLAPVMSEESACNYWEV